MKNKKIMKNAGMLYLLTAARYIFPLLTLPYLTRVLGTEEYAVVTYIKSIVVYFQIIVDFGFILSATKSVVEYREDPQKLSAIVTEVTLLKLFLMVLCGLILYVIQLSNPLVKNHGLYAWLSMLPILTTVFMFDYLFRGLEEMQVITIRFVLMKGVSTVLTFIMVHSGKDLELIPILETVGGIAAVIAAQHERKKRGIMMSMRGISIKSIRKSFVNSVQCFVTNMISTSFGALNTFVAGFYLTPLHIAFWGVVTQIITSIQALYTPISDSIYPEMIKQNNFRVVLHFIKLFTPLLCIGCFVLFTWSEVWILLVAGSQYIEAASVLRMLVPVAFFSFFVNILGWPTLGAIGKTKEITINTLVGAATQIVGLLFLGIFNCFTIMNMAVIRSLSEIVLFAGRIYYCVKFRKMLTVVCCKVNMEK